MLGSPGKQVQLMEKAARKAMRLGVYAGQVARDPDAAPCIEPLPHDHRFEHEGWGSWPYNMIYQSFLLSQQWWYNAACGIDGVGHREEQVVSFVTRQMLDMMSPSNFIATNPEVARATMEEGGANLVRGLPEFPRGLGTRDLGQASGRHRGLPARPRRGHDARQGRVPQSPAGADPVRARDEKRSGPSRS